MRRKSIIESKQEERYDLHKVPDYVLLKKANNEIGYLKSELDEWKYKYDALKKVNAELNKKISRDLNTRTESKDELAVVRNSKIYRRLKESHLKMSAQKHITIIKNEELRQENLKLRKELAYLKYKLNNP